MHADTFHAFPNVITDCYRWSKRPDIKITKPTRRMGIPGTTSPKGLDTEGESPRGAEDEMK